jgi:hypothetical protein
VAVPRPQQRSGEEARQVGDDVAHLSRQVGGVRPSRQDPGHEPSVAAAGVVRQCPWSVRPLPDALAAR